MTPKPSQSSMPELPRSRRPYRRRRPPARSWSDSWVVRVQQQGATVAGWFFLVVGFIGLVGSTVETIQGDHPVLARVISSTRLPDEETVVVTRVALPDGRVGVIEPRESYRVSSQMKVLWEGDGNAYEEYAPMNRWIGSGVAFGVGALLVGGSRATRGPGASSLDGAA